MSRIEKVFEHTQVPTCCPGYAEAPNKQCLPICLNSCNNGHCIKPGVCKCSPEPSESSPGFAGSTCKRFVCLAANKWGSKCDRECNCPSNSYCSASTGNCLCHSGWRGANCTEECDSSMSDCNGVELPPIVEPEANMIPELVAQSQRLEALAPRALQGFGPSESNEDDVRMAPASNLLATHMGINMLFCVFTVMLVGAVFWYKKRLSQVENKLYHVAASASFPSASSSSRGDSGDSCGGSDYSPYSIYSQESGSNNRRSIQDRPLPSAGNSCPLKETFESATRNILQQASPPNQAYPLKGSASSIGAERRAQIIVAPRVECHLMSSQQSSKQNIYSEPHSSTLAANRSQGDTFGSSDRLISRRSSNAGQADVSGHSYILNVSTNSALESDYQVPKSPRAQTMHLDEVVCLDNSVSFISHNDDASNIYEEIHPRTPTSTPRKDDGNTQL